MSIHSPEDHSKFRNANISFVSLSLLLAGLWLSQSTFAGDLERAIPEDVGLSSERLERLSNMLSTYVEDDKLPGGVALVARHGKVAYLESFGHRDLAEGEEMQDDDIFRIASQTKNGKAAAATW